jgi:hypothetical protein
MFTEHQLRESARIRARVLVPALIVGVAGVFLYIALVALIRESFVSLVASRAGEGIAEYAVIGLALPAFAAFLLPVMIAERYARRFRQHCPGCSEDLTGRMRGVLATRRCPRCEEQIVEGGCPRSWAAYARYESRRFRAGLTLWLWFWPILAAVLLVWACFDRTRLQQSWPGLLIAPVFAAALAAWTWLRTFDRRYFPQLMVSVVLLAMTAALIWRIT